MVKISLIEINDLTFSYNTRKPLFRNITTQFDAGEFVAIIGRNGAGKTTLAKLLIGMLKYHNGEIIVDGNSIKGKSIAQIAEQIGYVFQNPNTMLFTNSVEKELELSLFRFNLTKEEKIEKINFMLSFFSLENYRNTNPRLLSRGEKQKLALATVLIQEPKAIILDEPFSGIDKTQKILIKDFLLKLKHQGKLVIIITHDLEIVLENADRVIAVDSGKIVFDDETRKFFLDPINIRKIGLIENNMLSLVYSLREHGLPKEVLKKDELINYLTTKTTL